MAVYASLRAAASPGSNPGLKPWPPPRSQANDRWPFWVAIKVTSTGTSVYPIVVEGCVRRHAIHGGEHIS